MARRHGAPRRPTAGSPPRLQGCLARAAWGTEGEMGESVINYLNLTRICEFTRALHQLHQIGGDEVIDREFNAVCRVIWGYSLDDFTDAGRNNPDLSGR